MDLFSIGNMLKRVFRIVPVGCILPWLLLFVCSYPPVPEDKDLVELERIWQYCKAFSLYSDRVPTHERLLEFNNPSELVDSIYDTLYSHWKDTTWFWAIYTPDFDRVFNSFRYRNGHYYLINEIRQNQFVNFQKLTDSTAYLYIKTFDDDPIHPKEKNTYTEFLSCTSSVKNIPNLIINLRHNGGGYVGLCQAIIEHLLPANVPYLTVKQRRISSDTGTVDTVWASSDIDSNWGGKKIVILQNEGTASASEILTVALRDGMPQGSVYIVGETSFGKAIGQVIFHMLNDAGLMLTTLSFLPRNGINYHEVGIIPDLPHSGSFREEIITAGKWLEPGFETVVNTAILNAIVSTDSYQQVSPVRGYLKIVKKDELPF